jgi:hypothetical protein
VIPAVGAAALVEESSGEAEHAEKEAGKATLGVARTFVGWVGGVRYSSGPAGVGGSDTDVNSQKYT